MTEILMTITGEEEGRKPEDAERNMELRAE